MFGMGGNIKQFGMGVVFSAKNEMRGVMSSLRNEFSTLRTEASKSSQQIVSDVSKIKSSMWDATKGVAMVGTGTGMMAAAWKLSTANRESERLMSNFRTLGVMDMDHKEIVRDSKEVEASINDMLRISRIPFTKSEILGGAYDLKSMAISKADQIAEASKIIGLTAKAGVGSYQDALDSFRMYWLNFASKSNMPFESKLTDFLDVIPSVIMQNNLRLPQLTSQLDKAGGAAAAAGWNIKETASALGILISTGMGERSGTSLLALGRNLDKSGKELGLNFLDANKRALPLIQILGIINKKFGEIDEVEKAKIIKAFGEEAALGIVNLNANFDKLKKNIESISPGTGLKMAMEAIDNTDDSIVALNNSWKILKENIASTGINSQSLIYNLTKTTDKAADFVQYNPKLSGAFIKGLFGIGGLAASGGILRIIGAGFRGWMPLFRYGGFLLGEAFGVEFVAAVTTTGAALLPAAIAAMIGPVGAYMKSNKMLRDLGIDPKTGKPIGLEVYDPSTGKTYYGKRTGFNTGLGLMAEDDQELAQRSLNRSKKWGDIKVAPGSVNLSEVQMKGTIPSSSAVTTYQDNRSMPITVNVQGGVNDAVDKRNIQLMTEAIQRQLDEDAEYQRLRHGASPGGH